jgi:serine protease
MKSRFFAVLVAAAVVASATPAASAAEADIEARVIVAFKADAALARGPAAGEARAQRRAEALTPLAGRPLAAGRLLGQRQQVLRARGVDSNALARRLSAHPEVEWAVPDRRRRALFVPNDPLYPQALRPLGPDAGQWHLRPPDALFRSAADFESAWDRRRGDGGIAVAVIDTGVRPDHPDLAGVLLPGIDTIADADIANDGDGPDGDASDPGDWITPTENTSRGVFRDCGVGDSSWHGTLVSTIVGAVGNEGIGMAGAAHGIRVLPVRVLGKCGGYDSDIIAGMLWAAGLQTVAGIRNDTPARILNLSLGGGGACTQAYVDAVARINAAGSVVVAAAGNDVGLEVGSPANCPGVIGVGGLRHAGSKVGFSDLGPEIALSAPGGNCVNIDGINPCLYPILAGTNSGGQGPVAGGSTWTDGFDISVGTSFAAPLVSGAAALAWLQRPALTPAELRQVLQTSTRPFPQDGADNGDDPTPVVACRPPDGTEQLQCYCPNPAPGVASLCGAGMLDAAGAVRASEAAFARIALVGPANPVVGEVLRLDAGGSLPRLGGAIVGYAWSLPVTGGVSTGFAGATDAATATLPTAAAGTLTVRLTVTDDRGDRASTDLSIAVAPASRPGGGTGGGALGVGWLLALGAAVLGLRRARDRG